MSKLFEADYSWICPVCSGDIEIGEAVYDLDNEIAHADCHASAQSDSSPFKKPKVTPDNICPICSLDHAGECW